MQKTFLLPLFVLLLAGCQSIWKKQGVTGDVFDKSDLSVKAQTCLKECEVKIAGPEAIDRSKECACDCHKKHQTGRFKQFCSDSGYLKSERIDTIHDSMIKGGGIIS